MNHHKVKEIIDMHHQKHINSCIPSSVEMVLKILGKVDWDYYLLQNTWQEKIMGVLIILTE